MAFDSGSVGLFLWDYFGANVLAVYPWVTAATQGWGYGVSDRGGPHPVKGYIMYSIIYGIVYPFTGVRYTGTQ